MCYVDDADTTLENEDNLQRILYKFEPTVDKDWYLIWKGQILTFAKKSKQCKLIIYNHNMN